MRASSSSAGQPRLQPAPTTRPVIADPRDHDDRVLGRQAVAAGERPQAAGLHQRRVGLEAGRAEALEGRPARSTSASVTTTARRARAAQSVDDRVEVGARRRRRRRRPGRAAPSSAAGAVPVHRLHRHAVGGRVARGERDRLGVAVDRDRRGAQARALDRHRAAAAADVPHQVAGARAEPRERERADLGLGHHPGAVLEGVVGQRPARRRARRPHPRAPVAARRRIEHDEHVGLGERRPRELLGRAAHDALVVARPGARPPRASRPLPARRSAYQAGGAAGAVRIATFGWRRRRGQRRVRVAPVRADDERVVPRQAEAGEGDRHRRRRRVHVERARRPTRAPRARTMPKKPGSPVASTHGRAVVGGERVERRLEVAGERDPLRARRAPARRGGARPPATSVARAEQLRALRGERPAVHAEHRDHARASAATRSRAPGLAPTTCAPSKSTIDRVDGDPVLDVARRGSPPPWRTAGRGAASTPAASHSSYAWRALLASLTAATTLVGAAGLGGERRQERRVDLRARPVGHQHARAELGQLARHPDEQAALEARAPPRA